MPLSWLHQEFYSPWYVLPPLLYLPLLTYSFRPIKTPPTDNPQGALLHPPISQPRPLHSRSLRCGLEPATLIFRCLIVMLLRLNPRINGACDRAYCGIQFVNDLGIISALTCDDCQIRTMFGPGLHLLQTHYLRI
jgi:hypothetical protein